MFVLKIVGCQGEWKKVSMTKLLRDRLDISLAHAKKIADDVLDGEVIFITADDEQTAKNWADELAETGAIVEIEN
ncbi:MAG TPA: hypothetical protein VGC76_02880 [Pyrinomonadaceae bacterium]|jgi:hypothetical protein